MPDQHGRLCDLLPGSFAPGVGLVGQLVHIIADSRQFPKQGGVFIRRTGAKIHPQDQLPEQRLHFQSCGLRLFSQVSILTGVQAQGDRFKGLHRLIPLFHYFFVVIFQNELMGEFPARNLPQIEGTFEDRGIRGGAPEQRNFAVKIPCWRGQRRYRRRCLPGGCAFPLVELAVCGSLGRCLLTALLNWCPRGCILCQCRKIIVLCQRQ